MHHVILTSRIFLDSQIDTGIRRKPTPSARQKRKSHSLRSSGGQDIHCFEGKNAVKGGFANAKVLLTPQRTPKRRDQAPYQKMNEPDARMTISFKPTASTLSSQNLICFKINIDIDTLSNALATLLTCACEAPITAQNHPCLPATRFATDVCRMRQLLL